MEYRKSLAQKFTAVSHSFDNDDYSPQNPGDSYQGCEAPVVQNVKETLQRQSNMIDNMIAKKRNQQQKWSRISSANLEYREKLRKKISDEQQKHKKSRHQFLDKRVKSEKFKISEVYRKKQELEEKREQRAKSRAEEFKSYKSKTIQFWNKKDANTAKSYAIQTAAFPLYEDAIYKKKHIEEDNIRFGQTTKEQLLARHSKCLDLKQTFFVHDNRPYWDQHAQQCEKNYQSDIEIQNKKNNKFVNQICHAQNKSQKLVKDQKQAWEKKLKGRLIDQSDKIEKTRDNFMQYHSQRSKTLKQCRCHSRGKVPKLENEEQFLQNEEKSQTLFKKTSLPLFTRSSFSHRAKIHNNIVMENKLKIKEMQDAKDERKLMLEKQISEAVRTRNNILNQSNNLARAARVNA